MLSDVTLHKLVIEPKKPPTVEYAEGSSMTDTLKMKDQEIDPMERRSVATETEAEETKASAEGVTISEETIALMESLIHDSSTSRIYDRLLPFHTTSLVQLQPIRTYPVPLLLSETLPVVSISCGSAGRTAILVGESEHETWCSHEGKVIITQRSKATTIPLAVCPSSSSWSPHGVLAVGDVAGDVHAVIGEAIVGVAKVHTQAVSFMEWISPSQILSCGVDGNITLLQLKGTSFDIIKTVKLTVSDLPRIIRKSSSSVKAISVVSMSRFGSEVCVATETGGIWIFSLPDLHSKTVPSEPQAIRTVVYSPPLIALSGEGESSTLMDSDGTFMESLSIDSDQICKIDEFLLFSDGSRVLVYDLSTSNVVLDEKRIMQSFCTTPQGDLVVLTENELVTLRIVKGYS
ncbi:unnamed protein product [Cylicocyclus nassatus]|uniref:Uncharacterized protein n=1 Tax=Cylicocyclus nassatus TaxID=53992 RepID=A0AA36GNA7_CYLNA|nr:unnamed protein product [Cylicocyclus nassatus]